MEAIEKTKEKYAWNREKQNVIEEKVKIGIEHLSQKAEDGKFTLLAENEDPAEKKSSSKPETTEDNPDSRKNPSPSKKIPKEDDNE